MISTKQLMEATGITYRQADYWSQQGYLEPQNKDNVYTGTPRVFDEAEIRVAEVLREFGRCGIQVSTWGPEFLREAILETSSDEIAIGRDDFELTIRLHVDH